MLFCLKICQQKTDDDKSRLRNLIKHISTNIHKIHLQSISKYTYSTILTEQFSRVNIIYKESSQIYV